MENREKHHIARTSESVFNVNMRKKLYIFFLIKSARNFFKEKVAMKCIENTKEHRQLRLLKHLSNSLNTVTPKKAKSSQDLKMSNVQFFKSPRYFH